MFEGFKLALLIIQIEGKEYTLIKPHFKSATLDLINMLFKCLSIQYMKTMGRRWDMIHNFSFIEISARDAGR